LELYQFSKAKRFATISKNLFDCRYGKTAVFPHQFSHVSHLFSDFLFLQNSLDAISCSCTEGSSCGADTVASIRSSAAAAYTACGNIPSTIDTVAGTIVIPVRSCVAGVAIPILLLILSFLRG